MRVTIYTDGGVLQDEINGAVMSTGLYDKISMVRTGSGRFTDDEVLKWCIANNKTCTQHANNESLYGKSACFHRNDKFVNMSDCLIVISRGYPKVIVDMMDKFRAKRKRVHLVAPKEVK